MTTVYCTAQECEYYEPYDEDYGICQKDHITLDEGVDDIMYGCPNYE